MGTRSLINIYEKPDSAEPFVTIYRQFDGYPSVAGEDIKKAIGGRTLVNGFQDRKKQCNGMACAAALLISALKGDIAGGFYIYPAGTKDCGEEYTYNLFPSGEHFRLTINAGGTGNIWEGLLHEMDGAAIESAE